MISPLSGYILPIDVYAAVTQIIRHPTGLSERIPPILLFHHCASHHDGRFPRRIH